MARRGSDVPETLVHVLTVANSAGVPVHAVQQKLRDADVYEDWEGSAAVLRSKARALRAELIAEEQAKTLRGLQRSAEIDKQKRAARVAAAEARRKNREASFIGVRVSGPDAAPEPWMDLTSEGEE
jgi:hypothetical protein